MKILYIANFDQPQSNQDEEAITHALRQLGHEVLPLRERNGVNWSQLLPADFLLCHHWSDFNTLSKVSIPVVFWCFDLIDSKDPTLRIRDQHRIEWVTKLTSICSLGFLTDEDWVHGSHEQSEVVEDAHNTATDSHKPPKLFWLPQGADERVAGMTTECGECHRPYTEESEHTSKTIDLLFVGTSKGGQKRESFVKEMRERYGSKFVHIEKNTYGKELAKLIARTKIVLAPDGPVTDRYWSNRVFMSLGFGAFMLHPWCKELGMMYEGDKHIKFYHDREDLHNLINVYLKPEKASHRQAVAKAGHEHTLKHHLYRHRCEKLIQVVKERLRL